jgi:DNA polymerase I
MNEDSQSTLTGFGEDEDRPTAEAEAVAGSDRVGADVVDAEEFRYPEADGEIELSVTQVNYTVEGYGDEEYPVVHVFGRTPGQELVHVEVYEFKPYFYAPTATLDFDDLESRNRITGWEAGYESIRGEELTKIFGQTPRDVGQIRDEFDHYEADILFPNRLLIDKDITSGIRVPERWTEDGSIRISHDEIEAVDVEADPRVSTFDIEVDDRSGFPEDGEEPIICLASHDSYRDEYVLWLYDADEGGAVPERLAAYEPLENTDLDADIRVFDEEPAMLDAFVTYLEETDPDILTGWNFADFDAPYLIDRLEVLDPTTDHDLDYNRLSRVNEVWQSDWQGPDIKGRVVFDLLRAYKRTQFTELESYRLEAVGETELGAGKETYTGDIGDLWENDPERLLEYNLRDVELCVELDRKQDIIAFFQEIATFVGCKLEDAPTPGDAVDMYVLHKAHGRFALPSKGTVESGEEFEGGAVFDPITGVREMVSVLDLKSLYPMCMVTINASPETIVDPERYDGETFVAPNGQHFSTEPDGIIREMVTELLSEREEKKELRNQHEPGTEAYDQYDRQQGSVKVIMNSLYGVSGWDRFRLYDKDSAAAVTATGRAVIDHTEDAVEDLGYEVAYGDSVTGDRPIVVRDPNGKMRIAPIEELFGKGSEIASGDVLITADGGDVATSSPGKDRRSLDGWDALSLSDEGIAGWHPIEQVIRHETDKEVVTLQHKFGESTTTRDHSYVVEDSDEHVEARPEEVEEPLRVPSVPSVEEVETIDVYEVLSGYMRTYKDGRSVGSENAEKKTNRVHADDERVWFGHEHQRDQRRTVSVQRYIEINSDDGKALIRLLAAYIAEGSASTVETTDSRFGASISESRREWLEQLQDDYYCLFDGTTAGILDSDTAEERTVTYDTEDGRAETTYDDGTKKLQMMNELAAVFFREFAGQRSHGKRIPSFVYHLPDDEQQLFLDVLVEGDGSREFPRYSEEYAAENFDYETTSRELAAGLSMLLTQRDRKHSLKYRDSKGSYTIRTCQFYRSGRDPVLSEQEHDGYVYDLSVAENDNFVDGVGGIVLHNTDSVMLDLKDDAETIEDAIDQSFDIEEAINASYDEFAKSELDADEHRFQIEFEKLYRRFFQAGKKKRYAGHIVWKEGKEVDDVDITGFEYQRSDIAQITKEVQLEVLEMIVKEGDIEGVTEYLNGVIEDFLKGNMHLEKVAIPGGIGKRLDNYDTDTAQVRGAKYANLLLGTNFQRGSKPKRLYLKKIHPEFFRRVESEMGLDPAEDVLYGEFKRDPDVICFEYDQQIPEEFEVDWEKMLDKTLKGPIERVIEALGISWDEVKSGQEQTGLGQFM